MTLLKGDVVRLKTGETGEIIEVWGLARTFARVRTEDQVLLVTATDITKVVRRTAIRSLERR
jgi:hypothetical protein